MRGGHRCCVSRNVPVISRMCAVALSVDSENGSNISVEFLILCSWRIDGGMFGLFDVFIRVV